MKTVAFIPIKLNNERLPGKNIRRFDNGEPLLTYILSTALHINAIDDIYVYCSSEQILEYLPQGVKFLKRPISLDSFNTSITEVIASFTETISADVYTLLHATSPFISVKSIEAGLQSVQNGVHDSALAVYRHYDFLWRGGVPENYDVHNVPRTQDLEPFYTETSGFFIFTKALAAQKRRVGDRPFLVEVSKIEAIDIDESIDFDIANAILNHILLKGYKDYEHNVT